MDDYRRAVLEVREQVGAGGVDVADSLNGLMTNLEGGGPAILQMAKSFRERITKKVGLVAFHILHEASLHKEYIDEILSFQHRVIRLREMGSDNLFQLRLRDATKNVDTGWIFLKLTEKGFSYVSGKRSRSIVRRLRDVVFEEGVKLIFAVVAALLVALLILWLGLK